MYEVGCAARVLKMLKFPDNTVRVLVEGLWRIRIKAYESQKPYLKAKIEVQKDIVEDSIELSALTRNAQGQFQEIVKLSPAIADQVKIAALNTERPRAPDRFDRGEPEPESGGAAADARNALGQGAAHAALAHA